MRPRASFSVLVTKGQDGWVTAVNGALPLCACTLLYQPPPGMVPGSMLVRGAGPQMRGFVTLMERRSDKRVSAVLLVSVSGVDVAGYPFTVVGQTLNFSQEGARLGKIQARVKCGDEVSIEYRGNRACFVIIWMGPPHSIVEGQLGLKSLEPTEKLWASELQQRDAARDEFVLARR